MPDAGVANGRYITDGAKLARRITLGEFNLWANSFHDIRFSAEHDQRPECLHRAA
jgi:hypothetical protein